MPMLRRWSLVSANVDFDPSGRSYGTASVIMANPQHARSAVAALENMMFEGQRFSIELANSADESRLPSGIMWVWGQQGLHVMWICPLMWGQLKSSGGPQARRECGTRKVHTSCVGRATDEREAGIM